MTITTTNPRTIIEQIVRLTERAADTVGLGGDRSDPAATLGAILQVRAGKKGINLAELKAKWPHLTALIGGGGGERLNLAGTPPAGSRKAAARKPAGAKYANASLELAERATMRQIMDGVSFSEAMDATLASDADLAARYRAYSIGDDRPNASIEVAARAKARKAQDNSTYEQAEHLVLAEDPDLQRRYDAWRSGKE